MVDDVDQVEYCLMSLISLILLIFHAIKKAISTTHLPSRLFKANKRPNEASECKVHPLLALDGHPQENSALRTQDSIPKSKAQHVSLSGSRDIGCSVENLEDKEDRDHTMVQMLGSESAPRGTIGVATKRKRPAMIVIPESCMGLGFGEACKEKDSVARDLEVEGSGYCMVSRKGNRHVMEDSYGVMTNIHGDPKQALFGVFDGHGGRAAVDFVSERLGKNIITAISHMEEEDQLELAIRAGYLTTDRDFLNKNVSSGACAATVLLRNGELLVSNVGDCRVVMSRNGVASALTCDHRAGREDERIRIESSGGFVTCRNGTWRVQDSLAVSRAIGDANMKEWIISEPETARLRLTPDCEFLIMASDGLWDKVSNQEAVDVVSRLKNSMKSCKELVEMSCIRGSRDDKTVMVVDLQRFVQLGS